MKSNISLHLLTVSTVFLFVATSTSLFAQNNDIVLTKDAVKIVMSPNEPAPLQLAVRTLVRDFNTVMGFEPEIVGSLDQAGNATVLFIQNDSVNAPDQEPLEGFEAHRVSVSPTRNIIYLRGHDMRGTIYAVYTFSERFLGVPPLWFFSSWVPNTQERITVPRDTFLDFKPPQVRYRAWFPNDTRMFSPWRRLSVENNTLWLETMLRHKLNTVELGSTIRYPGRMTDNALLLRDFGLILTSHHMVALNSGFGNWETYWRTVKGQPAPELLLSNEEAIIGFYRYNIETVIANDIENLWQIAFRGFGDAPFWANFADAPETEPERVEVINRHLQIQLDLIREITGEEEPYVRMTFYDELSDFLAMGLLKPPTGGNMIWTFCSARRDHFPNDDIVNFDTSLDVKLGYYMNFQFSSTGSHLAPAEGPWKMEFNYRYVNEKRPLYFSVVNAGNLREHLFELAANAAMLWCYDSYDSDSFLLQFCETYFGKEHVAEVAALYRDFYNAYWEPTAPSFPGLERQFLFHDLRHSRVIRQIAGRFSPFVPEPLRDIGFERMPGRSFRITPADNESTNTVDAILFGTKGAAERFEQVADRCDELILRLPEEYRHFFNDNLRGYARFMAGLSRSVHDFVYAYKHQADRSVAVASLQSSLAAMQSARQALLQTQHGVFERWYEGDANNGMFDMPHTLNLIETIIERFRPSDNR